jgi:hypothetical protein
MLRMEQPSLRAMPSFVIPSAIHLDRILLVSVILIVRFVRMVRFIRRTGIYTFHVMY